MVGASSHNLGTTLLPSPVMSPLPLILAYWVNRPSLCGPLPLPAVDAIAVGLSFVSANCVKPPFVRREGRERCYVQGLLTFIWAAKNRTELGNGRPRARVPQSTELGLAE